MKTRLFLTYTCSLMYTLAALQSCTQEDTPSPAYNDGSIRFSVSDISRSIINSPEEMTDYHVWGWYGQEGSFTAVFDELPIQNDNSTWTPQYGTEAGKQKQYWKFDTPYRFYAVSGYAEGSVQVDPQGIITVEVGEDDADKDLLTAYKEDISYSSGTEPQPVPFHFRHEKAKIGVKLSAAASLNGAAEVTEVRLSNIYRDGTLTYDPHSHPEWQGQTWEYGSYKDYQGTTGTLAYGASYAPIDDLLVPPQDLGNNTILTIRFNIGEKIQEKSFNLSGISANWWTRGQGYLYTFTLREDGIYFDGLTKNEWGESHAGGDINIGG